MTNPDLGVAVKDAVRFLEQFYVDVYRQVSALDAAMLAHGWTSLFPNKINDELGNGLDSASWVLHDLWRLYAPDARISKVAGFHFAFAPRTRPAATVVVIAARYGSTCSTREQLWQEWSDSDAILEHIGANPGPVALPSSIGMERLLVGALHVNALTVPLVSLESSAAVDELARKAIGMIE